MIFQFLTHGEQLSHRTTSYISLKNEYITGSETTYNWIPYVLNVPEGDYSGSNLVPAIQELLNSLDENFMFYVICNPARGTVNIEKNLKGYMLILNSLYQVILE